MTNSILTLFIFHYIIIHTIQCCSDTLELLQGQCIARVQRRLSPAEPFIMKCDNHLSLTTKKDYRKEGRTKCRQQQYLNTPHLLMA